jgi:hypothetical protein
MNILPGFKLCRKELHQYPADKKRCPECQKESSHRWREENPERQRENSRRWREQNADRNRENMRRWREQNRERDREYNRRWYEENAERQRENSRRWYEKNRERDLENSRRWQKQNPDKARAKCMRRLARKKQATPPWADHDAINAIYAEAVRLEQETGIKHHVDHIYPLTSSYLCGLHVAENLQILTYAENISKGNRTWPGQLDCQRLPPHRNGFTQDFEWSDSQGLCPQEDIDRKWAA